MLDLPVAPHPFPTITHIDDVWPALQGDKDARSSFIRFDRDGYVSLDYVVTISGVFGCLATDDSEARTTARLRREARGIKFCPKTGRIVARPYPKFFNLGETRETQPDGIDWAAPLLVLEKLDGSMIHPTPVADGAGGTRLIYTTAGGDLLHEPVSRFIEAHPNADYAGFCQDLLAAGYTPIFEWVSPAPGQRIVLEYPGENLILTAVRETQAGGFVDYDAMAAVAGAWGIPVVALWARGIGDIHGFIAELRQRRDIEGVVIRWPGGESVKLKTDDYRMRHQFLEDVEREDKALEIVLAGEEDDLLSTLAPSDQAALNTYARAVRQAIAALSHWAESTVTRFRAVHGDDRRRFVREVADTHASFHRTLLLNTMNRGDARAQLMRQLVEPQNQRVRDLAVAKQALGLPDWHRMRATSQATVLA